MSETVKTPKKKYKGSYRFNVNMQKPMYLLAPYRNSFGRVEGVYSDAYDELVGRLVWRVKHDMQNVVLVEGETGSGKSAFALNLCVDLARALKVGFDLEHDYVYSSSDLWKKLENPDANPINLLDEGTVTIASNNAMQKSDKNIAVLFDTMRSRHWTTIICSPNSQYVNKSIRVVHAEFKIRCTPETKPLIPGYGRGFFECRRAERMEFGKDEPRWLMMYAGVFGDYPPMLRDEYLHIKAQHQQEMLDQMVTRAKADEAKIEQNNAKILGAESKNGVW